MTTWELRIAEALSALAVAVIIEKESGQEEKGGTEAWPAEGGEVVIMEKREEYWWPVRNSSWRA